MPRNRREEFKQLIDRALAAGPYKDQDPHLHAIYSIGLLRELLAYSALDLMEVRDRLEYLASNERKERKTHKDT